MRALRFFSLIAVLAMGLRGAADEPKTEIPTTLDSARRDLKDLSAVRPDSNIQPSFDEFSTSAPTFSAGRQEMPNREVSPRSPDSSGWLLDALDHNSLQAKRNQNGSDKKDTLNLPSSHADSNQNPLGNYLQQWLTPQSRAILQVDPVSDRLDSRQTSLRSEKSTAVTSAALQPLVGQPRDLAVDRKVVNPYLDPAGADAPLFPNVFSPTTETALPKLPSTSVKTATYPQSQDKSRGSRSVKDDDNLPPPTAPLLNEAKYFPQLRHF